MCRITDVFSRRLAGLPLPEDRPSAGCIGAGNLGTEAPRGGPRRADPPLGPWGCITSLSVTPTYWPRTESFRPSGLGGDSFDTAMAESIIGARQEPHWSATGAIGRARRPRAGHPGMGRLVQRRQDLPGDRPDPTHRIRQAQPLKPTAIALRRQVTAGPDTGERP